MEGCVSPSILMTWPLLQSISQTIFKLFLMLWERMGTHNTKSSETEMCSPKKFTFLWGQSEIKRGEREAQVSFSLFSSLSAAAGWALTWEFFLMLWSRNLNFSQQTVTTWVPNLHQPPEFSRSLYSSGQMIQNSGQKYQQYHYVLLPKKEQHWSPQHFSPLFLNKHAPCLDACLP